MAASRFDPGLTLVLTATAGLALKSVFAKLAFDTGMTVDGVLALRMAIAVPVIWAGAMVVRASALRGIAPGDHLACAGAGVLYLVAMICDLQAIALIGAGLSRVILFTFPLIIVLAEAIREGRMPAPSRILSFVLSYAGLLVMIGADADFGTTAAFLEGIAWAFGCALSYAAFLLAGQGLTRRIGSVPFTAVSNLGVLLAGTALMPLWLDPIDAQATLDGVIWTALMAVVSTAVPVFLLFEGIRRLGAQRAALVSLLGPVLTVIAAWAFLGETLTPMQVAGFAGVLMGIAVLEGVVPLPPRFRSVPGTTG